VTYLLKVAAAQFFGGSSAMDGGHEIASQKMKDRSVELRPRGFQLSYLHPTPDASSFVVPGLPSSASISPRQRPAAHLRSRAAQVLAWIDAGRSNYREKVAALLALAAAGCCG
jgi:hypothetical protein